MTVVHEEQRTPLARRELARRWAPVLVLAIAFVVVSAMVIPRMQAEGDPQAIAFDLDASQTTPGARLSPNITRNVYGFVVNGSARGKVSFTPAFPTARPGARTDLLISAGGGPSAPTRVSFVDAAGTRHQLGTAVRWLEHRVNVTGLPTRGRTRLEFVATNSSPSPQLIADRLEVLSYPPSSVIDASRWEVAGWVALIVLLGLALFARLRSDFPLVGAAALTAFLAWPPIAHNALKPLASDIWDPARHASWFDLDHGLLSGTFDAHSSLAVQLFHALTPITGTGTGGAGVASMLVGVAAIVALYALGRRVAGPVGAVTAVTCALLTDPFRLSLSAGNSTGTLVLAATLFLLTVHRTLLRGDREAMALLGGAGAIAVLAEPTWWPGVLAGIVLLALRQTPQGTRRRALVVALAVFVLVSLPSRVSVAHQSDGDATADVTLRTTFARNAEFVGRGHTAPSNRGALAAAPFSGQPVGLGSYVFGDHSLSVIGGGALSGVYDGLAASSARPHTKLVGLIVFLVELAGVVMLLFIPRLRLLVVIPAMVALAPSFLANREGFESFDAFAAFWPVLPVGAGAIVYAAWGPARARVEGTRLAKRASSLRHRLRRRSPQPG